MNLKPRLIKTFEEITKPRDERSKHRIYAFLICLAISLSIWFIIKMSKDYYSDIKYPIQYTSFPKGQTITNIKDSTIFLKIQSKGFSMFNSIYFQKKKPFKLNMRNLDIHSNRYTTGHYLLTKEVLIQIKNQFDEPNHIISVSPDTIFFQLEQVSAKEIAVQMNLSISTKKQFDIYGDIDYEYDTIIITGPPSVIDTIQKIKTEKISLTNLDKSSKFKIALINPKQGLVELSTDSIEVSIQVEEYTESVISIPINLINNEQLNLRLFPNEIKLTYLVALKDFQTVNSDMFEAQINFNPNRLRTQKVELKRYPSFVKISRIEPNIVEYIILK